MIFSVILSRYISSLPSVDGHSDDSKIGRKQLKSLEVVKSWQELSFGQIAGGTENNYGARIAGMFVAGQGLFWHCSSIKPERAVGCKAEESCALASPSFGSSSRPSETIAESHGPKKYRRSRGAWKAVRHPERYPD